MSRRRYTDLHVSGELADRALRARADLSSCELCARYCRVDRNAGELGECRTGARARVASLGPHFGEEAPLVGRGGSGTIFFAACNLHCVYCQNWDISQSSAGREVEADELAEQMLDLQGMGCENVNLVSPTHVVPMILEALDIACARGLDVPLVYNTGTYDTLETLQLLEDVVDVYLADAKYADAEVGKRLSGVDDYPGVMREALVEMQRQVGTLVTDADGIARHGLMIRHLVLPNELAGTSETMSFVADEIDTETYVNVMAQYRPCHDAEVYPEIDRPVTADELAAAHQAARGAGLTPRV